MIIQNPTFCFAKKYTTAEILNDAAKAQSFQDEFLKGEADYFEQCHDPRSGIVYDGLNLDAQTGKVAGVRNWSAPSKECLDLGLCIKALQGDEKAVQVVGRGDAARAKEEALKLLDQKMGAYQEFQRENPRYAGFLPWYFINGGKIEATPDWQGKIPGLDNGEWMWTMLTAEKALKEAGAEQLASKYQAYNQQLMDNVTKVFYDPRGVACRGDVRITENGYEALHRGAFMTGEHGVHEGCMLIHYLTLFGKDLPPGASDKIWDDIKMKRVESKHGTTWQGFWGSAHESWAYLFLPFRDHQGYQNLHRIREEVRVNNAVERGYPGLATSTNGPRGGYLSDCGIEGIGTQPVKSNDTFAVYGCFPLLLEFSQKVGPGNFGLAWLHNMLTAPRMQGPLGGGESGSNDGEAFSAMKTTDGTHPSLLGMMGGLEKETAAVMREKGVYDKFMARIDSEYRETFGSRPLKEPKPFVAPRAQVPQQHLGEYLVK
ncbi:MAG: hypothetical protein J0I12_03130 [Candidatus Eremiobacteraeota bacterium]|nr:hypothetical protein [Candidatus Eremiobacteraeota bacterium]